MNEHEQLHMLQMQHARAVEEVFDTHLLWMPKVVPPRIMMTGIIRTIVELSDGRVFDISTSAVSGRTACMTSRREYDSSWAPPT